MQLADGPAVIFLDDVIGEVPDETVIARVYVPVVSDTEGL
jgi:hypothetical protein